MWQCIVGTKMSGDDSQAQMQRAFDAKLQIPDDIDEALLVHEYDPIAWQIIEVARRATGDTTYNILARKHGSEIRVPGPLIGFGLPGADISQARAAATENVEIIDVR